MTKCCPDYCESCGEHHSGMCPPHEVRTTGQAWLMGRIEHLEQRVSELHEQLAALKKENTILVTMHVPQAPAPLDWREGVFAGVPILVAELPDEVTMYRIRKDSARLEYGSRLSGMIVLGLYPDVEAAQEAARKHYERT